MKVKCIDNSQATQSLTVGEIYTVLKKYKVLEATPDIFYKLKRANGSSTGGWLISRFVVIQDELENLVEDLYNE